jgi:predicted transcriptional regulator
MSKKRERLRILHDILSTIRDKKKARPTHVLYGANLSHTLLEEYLRELIERKLIEEHTEGDKRYYSLTNKGYLFLEKYRAVTEFIELFDL